MVSVKDMDEQGATGTFINYSGRSFNKPQMARIETINVILAEYGRALTVRQLYYQHVARGLIPNEQREYGRLEHLLGEARLAGLVSWTAIEDRGRNLMGHRTYDGPTQAIKEVRAEYKRDLWASQPIRLETWCEKQALEGVVGEICNEERVDFFSTKGYNSLSEMWRAGQRFANYYRKGQRPVVLHLGDHDPAGIDMTRDLKEKLAMFAGTEVTVIRIGLNMDQVERLNPPPQPAKESDSKTPAYVAEYGEDCWELDALPPDQLQAVIKDEVTKWREPKLWDAALKEEAEDKNELDAIIEELGGTAEPEMEM